LRAAAGGKSGQQQERENVKSQLFHENHSFPLLDIRLDVKHAKKFRTNFGFQRHCHLL
jgi:hypothetical protein